MDPVKALFKNRRPSQKELQDLRRRQNMRPDIKKSLDKGTYASQRADEAHNRNTNAALDAAHARAEAGYRKDGSEPATFFLTDAALNGIAKALLRHAPADGDQVVIGHDAANSMIFRNETVAKTILELTRTGHVVNPTGGAYVQGELGQQLGLVPNYKGVVKTIPSPNGVIAWDHNFGDYPALWTIYAVIDANTVRPVNTPGIGIYVQKFTKTQVFIQNDTAAAVNVFPILYKG